GEFVSEGIALAAERPAVRRGDDADPRAREAEHLLHLAVEVVRYLRARPEREFSVGVVRRDGGMRLERSVGVALEEEPVLAHVVGRREARLEVAEREMDLLEHVR